MSYITPHNQGTIGLSLRYLARKFGAQKVKQLTPFKLYLAIVKKLNNDRLDRVQDVHNLLAEPDAVMDYIHQQQEELT